MFVLRLSPLSHGRQRSRWPAHTQKIGSARSKPVDALISTIFAQTISEVVLAQYNAVTDSLRGSFPEIAAMLEAAEADLTGFAPLPRDGERRYVSDISMRELVHTLHDHAEPARPELYLTA